MTWSPPQPWSQSQTPYVHWWLDKEGIPGSAGLFDCVQVACPHGAGDAPVLDLPVPVQTMNPDFAPGQGWSVEDLGPALEAVPSLPPETVLVGVIDTGISLGNWRFRQANGASRFLWSWQQSDRFAGQGHLPFGRELFTPEIEAAYRAHSDGQLDGLLDEDGFNRAVGLVDPIAPFGHRDLDYRTAHGTHVLDLAAGAAPELNAPRQILSVNLPPQYVHGTAGNFLTFFAALGLERILHLADALWEVQHGTEGPGFPLVVNFSFGKMAGPKDGNSEWERAISQMIARRRATAPLRIVMPAGNQNLSRGNARAGLGKGSFADEPLLSALEVPWRIQPMDQTSNFVEIWAKSLVGKEEAAPTDFRLHVAPPGAGVGAGTEVPALTPGTYSDWGNFARVYCYQAVGQTRPHFVVSVAPSASWTSAEAPSGAWTLSLSSTHDMPQEVTFAVQSDQAGVRHAITGLRSYLDHPAYQRVGESGSLQDTYGIPEPWHNRPIGDLEPWATAGPVQRKGTHNALATLEDPKLYAIGGYRNARLRPVVYSSTFDGNARRGSGKDAPSFLYPSEDGQAHFGLLAAGSKEGATVALQGTSMAAGLASRDLVALLSDPPAPNPEQTLRTRAQNFAQAENLPTVHRQKQGAGLMPAPETGRLRRFGPQ